MSVQAISSPLMDAIGMIGIALLLTALGRDQYQGACDDGGVVHRVPVLRPSRLYDPVRKFALFNNSFQQALGASEEIFKLYGCAGRCGREEGPRSRF